MVTSKSLGIIPPKSLGGWETSNLSPHGGKTRVRRGEEGEEFYRYEVLEPGFQEHGLGARSEAGLEGLLGRESIQRNYYSSSILVKLVIPSLPNPSYVKE